MWCHERRKWNLASLAVSVSQLKWFMRVWGETHPNPTHLDCINSRFPVGHQCRAKRWEAQWSEASRKILSAAVENSPSRPQSRSPDNGEPGGRGSWRCEASWVTRLSWPAAAAPQGALQPIVLTGRFQDRVQFSAEEWAELWSFHQSCFYNSNNFYPQTVALLSTTAGSFKKKSVCFDSKPQYVWKCSSDRSTFVPMIVLVRLGVLFSVKDIDHENVLQQLNPFTSRLIVWCIPKAAGFSNTCVLSVF